MSDYAVVWKNEDEINGEPVGPVTVYTRAELEESQRSGAFGVPYDPNRTRPRWVTLREARQIATEHGTELEIS